MAKPSDLRGPGHPQANQVNRIQHVIEPGCELAPCPDCGSPNRPLLMKPVRTRRIVRCLRCGGFFTVPAGLTDAEIAAVWNQRIGSEVQSDSGNP